MTEKQLETPQLEKNFRYYLGMSFFILSLASPLMVPVITRTQLSTTMKTLLSGFFLVGGPELFALIAIGLLGKPFFQHLKSKIFALFKRKSKPSPVSKSRYRFGLVLFTLPFIFSYFQFYFPEAIPGYNSHRISFCLASELVFLLSLVVLGGEFWDKIKALFTYEAKIIFPEP